MAERDIAIIKSPGTSYHVWHINSSICQSYENLASHALFTWLAFFIPASQGLQKTRQKKMQSYSPPESSVSWMAYERVNLPKSWHVPLLASPGMHYVAYVPLPARPRNECKNVAEGDTAVLKPSRNLMSRIACELVYMPPKSRWFMIHHYLCILIAR